MAVNAVSGLIYVIKTGDTLTSIAECYNTTPAIILKYNRYLAEQPVHGKARDKQGDRIYPKDRIVIVSRAEENFLTFVTKLVQLDNPLQRPKRFANSSQIYIKK